MSIKKAYQDIVKFLEDNKDKKVKSILDEVTAMASAKAKGGGGASSFIRGTDGTVVAIFDYYFKRWMPLVGNDSVEYGAKASSASGLNSMCKEGVSHWTKQQRAAKTAEGNLLNDVMNGKLQPDSIADARAEIDTARGAIIETEKGFETKEELIDYLTTNGVEVSVTAETVEA